MKKTIQALREKQPEIRKELATEMAQGTEDDTSPDTSTEESCVYFAMKIMQSFSKEEGGYYVYITYHMNCVLVETPLSASSVAKSFNLSSLFEILLYIFFIHVLSTTG